MFGFYSYKENLNFFWQNISSKFSNTSKLIPVVFGGAKMSLKCSIRSGSIFVTTAHKFGVEDSVSLNVLQLKGQVSRGFGIFC